MQIDFYIIRTFAFADIIFDLDFYSWQQWKYASGGDVRHKYRSFEKKMDNNDDSLRKLIIHFFNNLYLMETLT